MGNPRFVSEGATLRGQGRVSKHFLALWLSKLSSSRIRPSCLPATMVAVLTMD